MNDACVLCVRLTGEPPGAVESVDAMNAVLRKVTPVVQALPPDTFLADVRGSMRYFQRDAADLARLVRVRALAGHGVGCTVGVSVNPLLARLAARAARPGAVCTVGPEEVAAFLAEQPVAALPGVGPGSARALHGYGLGTAGEVAAAPAATVQRILGARTGRLVHERARGVDPTPVVPNGAARSAAAHRRFVRAELDPGERRRALLALTVALGRRMRAEGQVARALTLTVQYADRADGARPTVRSRRLPEPTAHTPALTSAAYVLHDALGLQRARVTALGLRAEELTDAGNAGHQLTLDRTAENARRLEPVLDRAAARWPGSVGPAALAVPERRTA